jgi:hypothetical protein
MTSTDEIVAEISREMIRTVAPSELPMFRANSAAYFENPAQALKPGKSKDEMLGFGIADAAAYLTPVVLASVGAVVSFAIREFGKAVREQGESAISGWVKSLFKSHAPAKAQGPAQLTREQLVQLRAVAIEKARQYVDENQAGRLADELVGRFAAL